MASTSQGTNLSGEPMAARSGSQPKHWGLGAKAGVGLLCVALLAAGAIGLGVGLRKRDDDNSPPSAVTQGESGSTTASRTGDTRSDTVVDSETGDGSTNSGKDNTSDSGTCGSILDIVAENSELSTLLSLLQVTGLNETLSDSDLDYTLLAPSNTVLDTISPPPPRDTLANILQHHVVTAPVSAASLVDGAYLATVTGGFLNVSLSDDRVEFYTSDGASNAEVIRADLKTCKGYIHVLDDVLLTAELMNELGLSGAGNTTTDGKVADAGETTIPPGPGNTTVPGAGDTAGPPVDAQTPPVTGPVMNLTRGEDGKYTVCSGRWAPQEFHGPEPCGIRVRSTGVVNIGSQFGGATGYFTVDAADGKDDPCFKASLAGMFGQKLCQYTTLSGKVECLTEADGTDCICVAPFGTPAVRENNRKWGGNIEFNTFLKILRSTANLENPEESGATGDGVRAQNKVKTEQTLQDILNVVDCASDLA